MLTLQDLRIAADSMYDLIHNRYATWGEKPIQDVIDQIDRILQGVVLSETLPGQVPALDFQESHE
jgi:hypothetical protein